MTHTHTHTHTHTYRPPRHAPIRIVPTLPVHVVLALVAPIRPSLDRMLALRTDKPSMNLPHAHSIFTPIPCRPYLSFLGVPDHLLPGGTLRLCRSSRRRRLLQRHPRLRVRLRSDGQWQDLYHEWPHRELRRRFLHRRSRPHSPRNAGHLRAQGKQWRGRWYVCCCAASLWTWWWQTANVQVQLVCSMFPISGISRLASGVHVFSHLPPGNNIHAPALFHLIPYIPAGSGVRCVSLPTS